VVPSEELPTEDEKEGCGKNHHHEDLDAQVMPPWYSEVAHLFDYLGGDDCHRFRDDDRCAWKRLSLFIDVRDGDRQGL
jgi:hypothetical protein